MQQPSSHLQPGTRESSCQTTESANEEYSGAERAIRDYRNRINRRRAGRSRIARGYTRDKDTDQLLAFGKKWAAYGGPPDDEIFVTFGMTRERYDARVAELADDTPDPNRRQPASPTHRHPSAPERWSR